METFPERLSRSIEETGLGRPEFAARSGVGTSALAKWLSGKLTPKSDQLYALAKTAGVTMEWLLTGTGPKRIGLELWRHSLSLLARIDLAASLENKPDEGEAMAAQLFESLSSAEADTAAYVSHAERRAFLEAFRAADLEGKLEIIGKDRRLVEKYPDFLERFEKAMIRAFGDV